MKDFEDKLKRLEELSNAIKKPELKLEEALKYFEEGINLAKGMEKDIDKIEGKIQILMNNKVNMPEESPELDLFSSLD
ncbi:MAG: exodeoxyribonuclease VII small subunit [Treponemataceae bacterium]|nr:exodeoxyribonuclease VII small subunit [Treponemataceae bacterium]